MSTWRERRKYYIQLYVRYTGTCLCLRGEGYREGREFERRYTISIAFLWSISEFITHIKFILILQLSVLELLTRSFKRTDTLDNS
jgi:hypothetical protein